MICHSFSAYLSVALFPQAKLTEGLSLAKEFHSNVQELLTKMSKCEESIELFPAPSFVLDRVCTQLQDHRVGLSISSASNPELHTHLEVFGLMKSLLSVQTLVNEVNGYGEKKSVVQNMACRLTELSRKEDCDVVHNLIMTVQDRYKKLQQRAAERGRRLEEVKKSAKQVSHYITSNINT